MAFFKSRRIRATLQRMSSVMRLKSPLRTFLAWSCTFSIAITIAGIHGGNMPGEKHAVSSSEEWESTSTVGTSNPISFRSTSHSHAARADAEVRPGDSSRELPNNRDIAARFEKLKTDALNGDFSAAHTLHDALDNCHSLPPEQSVRRVGTTVKDSRSASARYKAETCHYFTKQQIDFDASLVHSLAELGDNVARVAYYKTGQFELNPASANYRQDFAGYAADSLRYLGEAAAQGDVDALAALGDAYSEGRIVNTDRIKAGAYSVTWQYIRSAAGGKGLDVDRLISLAESQFGQSLSAEQEARLVQLAAQIASNSGIQ